MRCCVFPEKVAVWSVPKMNWGISSQVAGVLDKERKLDLRKLKLSRHKIYDTENQQVSISKFRANDSGIQLLVH